MNNANQESLRTAVAKLHAEVIAMSNEKSSSKVNDHFLIAKDLLLEIYRLNVARLNNTDDNIQE